MKTNKYFVVFFLSIFQSAYCQISFGNEQIIEQIGGGFVHVHSDDLDGDEDMDVIASKYGALLWYENDGNGNFLNSTVITQGEGSNQSIYLSDLDVDGDLDILTELNSSNDLLVWFKNDGLGNFGSKIIISNEIDTGHCVFAADLDGDGDDDVLSASVHDDKIAWYENDGNGNFGSQQIVSSTTDGGSTVYAADLDGDQDLDIIAGGAWDNTLSWFENLDGEGSFGSENIISNTASLVQFAYAADLDGDGDQDIYFAAMGGNKIAWHQNDGDGNFGIPILIDFETDATDVFAKDFDNDGDLDIVSTADDGMLLWFENNGAGEFSEQITISDANNRSVYVADINGDGKMDVLTASFYRGTLSWYKNLGFLGVDDYDESKYSIYPNPTKGIVNIKSDVLIKDLKIINLLGEIVIKYSHTNKIDISHLNEGLYFLKVTDVNGNTFVKKLIKKN